MKLKPIINSLLETDAYKFSMGQAIFHQFNTEKVVWAFKCRNKDVKFTPEMTTEIREQIDHYCTLRFTDEELSWLNKNLIWIHEDYTDFLRFWHPRRSEIYINENNIQSYNDCGLAIECHGTWLNTSMYEIAILQIVNEVYYAFKDGVGKHNIEFQKRTMEKFDKLVKGEYDIGTFSEFGLRRRYSSEMQDWLINYIVSEKIPGFVGTSNVYLAKKYGVKSCGTMAHEFSTVLSQGRPWLNPAFANKYTMDSWVKEYGILNGIYLTDLIGTDVFLKDFKLTFATLFSGVRHDSGDPFVWGDKMIAHYKSLGIDPKTKTLLFSDSLDFERATKIKKYFEDKAKVAFGIGTYLSNPLDNPLNIVCKVVEANGLPCCKLSDVEGKNMCRSPEFVDYLKRCIEWRIRYER